MHSCLAALEERLKANGVDVDPIQVASAILGLARTLQWMNQPASSQCASSQSSSPGTQGATVICQDPNNPPTFYQDIAPLFRQMDVECMRNMGVLLLDYTYMSTPTNAQTVLTRLSGNTQGSQMPLGGPYWSQDNLDLFQQWIVCGFAEGTPDDQP